METPRGAKFIAQVLKQQYINLSDPTYVEMVEGILSSASRLLPDPEKIYVAARAGAVGFLRLVDQESAEVVAKILTLNTAIEVKRLNDVVQFWPKGFPVQLFKVRQTAPERADIGTVYALDGIRARELLAANAGFVARGPQRQVTLKSGNIVQVAGAPLFDADRSYYRFCLSTLSGTVGAAPAWECELIRS